MMNNCRGILKIRGVRKEPGPEAALRDEVHEMETRARFLRKEGTRFLFYQEETGEGIFCQSRLTVKEKEVILRRTFPGTGQAPTVLHFRKGEARECVYPTVAGLMKPETRTSRVLVAESKDFFSLKMEYALFLHGEKLSDHELTVCFSGADGPVSK